MPRAPKSKKAAYPKYETMINEAILHYDDKTGSSNPAIRKYLTSTYGVPEASAKIHLKIALKRLVEDGKLVQVRSSYRLSPNVRAKMRRDAKKAGGKKKAKGARSRTRSKSPATPKRRRSTTPKRKTTPKKTPAKKKATPKKKKPQATAASKTTNKPKPRTTRNSKSAGSEKGTRFSKRLN
eukprot:CAMPEP_0174260212 /NCGR_PEP_ID=MMETSP0439-20130205/9274_1 /TAXON_ID=0 /ORGANISM="Stereomyxa ramosa, Strain Chinc5" /LENGTH=180 /DNA_ID=CAMNT_0015344411 /DNA_START=26 /DNA_END=568 /DNA_ORIENTATION=-